MSVWPRVRLGDLLAADREVIQVDPTAKYRTAGIYSHGRGLFWRPEITGSEVSYGQYVRLRPDQFVFSKLFAWEGALAIASVQFDGALVSPEFPSYSIDVDRIDPNFLGYLVRRRDFYRSLATSGMGDRRQRVNPNILLDADVPLPGLSEQRQIARWLSAIDARGVRLCTLIDRLEWHDGGIRAAALSACTDATPVVLLGDLLSQRESDVNPEPASMLVQAGVYSFGKGLFRRPAIAGTDTSYRTMTTIHAGDFVYSKLMAWEGAVAVASEQHEGLLATPEFPVFLLDKDLLNAEYFGALIRTESFGSELRRLSTGTNARRRRVHPSAMMRVEIPLPPMKVQEHIAEIAVRLKQREVGRKLAQSRISAILPAALNHVFGSLN